MTRAKSAHQLLGQGRGPVSGATGQTRVHGRSDRGPRFKHRGHVHHQGRVADVAGKGDLRGKRNRRGIAGRPVVRSGPPRPRPSSPPDMRDPRDFRQDIADFVKHFAGNVDTFVIASCTKSTAF